MALTVTIWHNPRCSKSRAALKLLEERGLSPGIRLYLEDPPSAEEIRGALAAAGIPARSLVRKGESVFRDLGLSLEDDEETLIAAMVAHPILIERPVVFANGRAALGRPPEAVLSIL